MIYKEVSMRKFFLIALFTISVICFVFFFLYTGDSGRDDNSDITMSTKPALESITWFTSIPQIQAERLVNVFSLDTGINVKLYRNSTFIVKNKLMYELKSGKTEADVVTIADVGTYIELEENGDLLEYECPHYDAIPDIYKHPPHWAVFAGFGICMAYDKSRVTDPPQKWTDLLDERWKGHIGIEDINTAGSQYGQYYMLREVLGVEFWKKFLSEQKPVIYFRTEELANALLEGDIDVAGQFSTYTVYNYQVNKGTSIRGIYPKEGIPFILTPTGILRNSENPKKAKMFTDFLLSPKGQELMQNLIYKYSLRNDIAALENKPSLSKLNILLPDNYEDYSLNRDKYIKEFNGFLGDVY